tara:strand:+ start:347 stop:535 length:189 start_codon:yes stop_codon:yes gene_type:complete
LATILVFAPIKAWKECKKAPFVADQAINFRLSFATLKKYIQDNLNTVLGISYFKFKEIITKF